MARLEITYIWVTLSLMFPFRGCASQMTCQSSSFFLAESSYLLSFIDNDVECGVVLALLFSSF